MKRLRDLTQFEVEALTHGIDGLLVQILGEPALFAIVVADSHGQQLFSNGVEEQVPMIGQMLLFAAMQANREPPASIVRGTEDEAVMTPFEAWYKATFPGGVPSAEKDLMRLAWNAACAECMKIMSQPVKL